MRRGLRSLRDQALPAQRSSSTPSAPYSETSSTTVQQPTSTPLAHCPALPCLAPRGLRQRACGSQTRLARRRGMHDLPAPPRRSAVRRMSTKANRPPGIASQAMTIACIAAKISGRAARSFAPLRLTAGRDLPKVALPTASSKIIRQKIIPFSATWRTCGRPIHRRIENRR